MSAPGSDDWQLLNEYAAGGSEEAFRTLVDRYAGMVYYAALRQTAAPQLAEEVTQAVFIALAQKAGRISSGVLVPGWLFRATRFAVLSLSRAEATRRRHEHEAQVMQAATQPSDQSEAVWERIAPYLDEALAQLSTKDREAVIVRFFNNKSHKEAGAVLGISEEAAKKRLSRAIDKLRHILSRKGVAMSALAIMGALAAFGAKAAPEGVAAAAAAAALSHVAGGAISSPLIATAILAHMTRAKVQTIILTALILLLFAFGAGNLALQSISPPPLAPVARQPEPPPARIVVWDKHMDIPPAINPAQTGDATLEQALNSWSDRADGYWSVDYVVYDSGSGLQRLLDTFRNGNTVQAAGWTNVSGAARAYSLANQSSIPNRDVREALDRAIRDGASEGVLATERLLLEGSVASRMTNAGVLAATRECAARIAQQTHSFWTIIYTLRKSPLKTLGVKLVHNEAQSPYDESGPPVPGAHLAHLPQWGITNRFELTAEEIAAHQQAVKSWIDGKPKTQDKSP